VEGGAKEDLKKKTKKGVEERERDEKERERKG
jgi:hypothetical protein